MASRNITQLPKRDFGHFFTMLCEYLVVDRQGKTSVLGIFDRIWVRKFPGGLPNFYVVSSFSALASENTRVSVTIVNDDDTWSSDPAVGKLVLDDDHQPSGEFNKVQITMQFQGQEFPEPGLYWVEVRRDDEIVRRHPLVVSYLEEKPDADS